MEVIVSPLAKRKLTILLDYLEFKWSAKTKSNYLEKIYEKFELVSTFPRSCTKSKEFPSLYKCVVTKQSTFFYRIANQKVEIIDLVDTRQNPNLIREKLSDFFD